MRIIFVLIPDFGHKIVVCARNLARLLKKLEDTKRRDRLIYQVDDINIIHILEFS